MFYPKDLPVQLVTGRFANELFHQHLWSVRKRVEVSSQMFRSQLANVINISPMSLSSHVNISSQGGSIFIPCLYHAKAVIEQNQLQDCIT